MIGNAGDAGSELQAQLCGLAVLELVSVVKDGGNEGVDSVLGDVVAGQNHCGHSHGLGILRHAVGVGADGVLAVVGGGGDELVDVLVIDADQVNLTAGAQVGDGGGGGAGHDEGGVDLAVLQAVGAVAEALVNGLDVIDGHVITAQNVNCVEVNAGAQSTDGNALAAQILNGLDVGVHGDDLNLLHVEGGHGGEAVHSAGLSEDVGAVVSVAHNVRLAEAQLVGAGIHVLNIGLGAVAGDGSDGQVGVGGNILGNDAAERVVGAGLTAGDERQALIGAAGSRCLSSGCLSSRSFSSGGGSGSGGGRTTAGAECKYHAQSCKQSNNLFHF